MIETSVFLTPNNNIEIRSIIFIMIVMVNVCPLIELFQAAIEAKLFSIFFLKN